MHPFVRGFHVPTFHSGTTVEGGSGKTSAPILYFSDSLSHLSSECTMPNRRLRYSNFTRSACGISQVQTVLNWRVGTCISTRLIRSDKNSTFAGGVKNSIPGPETMPVEFLLRK